MQRSVFVELTDLVLISTEQDFKRISKQLIERFWIIHDIILIIAVNVRFDYKMKFFPVQIT